LIYTYLCIYIIDGTISGQSSGKDEFPVKARRSISDPDELLITKSKSLATLKSHGSSGQRIGLRKRSKSDSTLPFIDANGGSVTGGASELTQSHKDASGFSRRAGTLKRSF
jgi:hypothetical protein